MVTETTASSGIFALAAILSLGVAVTGQWEDSKIIDGTVVSIDKSPFLASFEERDNASAPFRPVCGCVIIDSKYIITAAHCFADIAHDLTVTFPAADLIRIRVGTSVLNFGGSLHSVAQYWVHPKFKVTKFGAGRTLDYDIAVARLSTPIVFGKSVAKATLIGVGQELKRGTKVIAAGWGYTKYDGKLSTQLRRAIFSVVEQPECNRQYSEYSDRLLKDPVSKRFLCTYAASKGTCFGDSGSAVYNRSDSVVVGIVSWGTCVEMPNVVTDLANKEIRSFIRSKSNLNV